MPSLYHFVSDQFKENLMLGGQQQHMVAGRLCQYLKSWQLDGLRFLFKNYEKGESCILNDESGLGKVVTVSVFLGAILTNDTTKKCLIVVRDDESLEGWRFHLSVLTALTVKVIEETSDINYETIFLIKWSTLKNIGQITKVNFDHIIIDNRGKMLDNKFCTGILLRYFENKATIVISSADVTADIKLLHILLRLCGRLDRHYSDVKSFEDKFQLPKLKEGVSSKVDLEDYFLKREKVINFCREFRLRRYRHQFDEEFPIVSNSEFRRHLEQWQNKNSQSSGSVKLLSSSSEKDIEELFKEYFQVKQEERGNRKLDCEVQQIIEEPMAIDGEDADVSDDLVVMSPLLFVSDSESNDSQPTQVQIQLNSQLIEDVKEEEDLQSDSKKTPKGSDTSPGINRRKSTKPVKAITKSKENVENKSLRSRTVPSPKKPLPVRTRKEDVGSTRSVPNEKKKDEGKQKQRNMEVAVKATEESGNKKSKEKTTEESVSKKSKEKATEESGSKKSKETQEVISSCSKGGKDKKTPEKEKKVEDDRLPNKEVLLKKKTSDLDLSCEKKNKEAINKTSKPKDVPKEKNSETKRGMDNQTKEKSANEKRAKPEKDKGGEQEKKRDKTRIEDSKTLDQKTPKQTEKESAKAGENTRSPIVNLKKQDKEKETKKGKILKKTSPKRPKSPKRLMDLMLYEAQKFVKNENIGRRSKARDGVKKVEPKIPEVPEVVVVAPETPKMNVCKVKISAPKTELKKSPSNMKDKPETPKRYSSLTELTPLGVHSRLTRGMQRQTRSGPIACKYMKVAVAQVGVQKKSTPKRLVRRRSSLKSMKNKVEAKPKAPSPTPPLIPESPMESMQLGQAFTPTNVPIVSEPEFQSPKVVDYRFPLMLDKDISDSDCLIESEISNNNEIIVLTGSSSNDQEMEPPKSTVSRRKTAFKPPMVTIHRPLFNKAKSPDLFSTCSDLHSLPCSQQQTTKSQFEGFKIFGSELRKPAQPRSCLDILERMLEPRNANVNEKKSSHVQENPRSASHQHCVEDEDAMFEITSNGTFGNIVRINSNGDMSPMRNKNQSTPPQSGHPKNRITNYLINSTQHGGGGAPPTSSLEDTIDLLPKTPKRRKSLSGIVKRSPKSAMSGGITGGKSQSTKLTQWLVKNSVAKTSQSPVKPTTTKRRRLDLSFPEN